MEKDNTLPQQEPPRGRVHRTKRASRISRLAAALLSLIIKLLIMSIFVFVLLNYVFGLSRNLSLNMQPAVKDGDLLFYFRMVDQYEADDVVVLSYHKKEITSRIVAVAGDSVDITEDGLMINGSLVQEHDVIGETTQFEGGVTFPLTVPSGEAFVLGDNREQATDSRTFGCVKIADIQGRVVGLFRRRNL